MQPAGALIPLPLVTSWNPLGLSRPVTGLLYLHLYIRRRWNSRLVKNWNFCNMLGPRFPFPLWLVLTCAPLGGTDNISVPVIPMYQIIMIPPSSGSNSILILLDPEGEGTVTIQNGGILSHATVCNVQWNLSHLQYYCRSILTTCKQYCLCCNVMFICMVPCFPHFTSSDLHM